MSYEHIRREKGVSISLRPGWVRRISPSVWKVRSESGRGAYTVRVEDTTASGAFCESPTRGFAAVDDSCFCACPDFENWGRPCKHVFAVLHTIEHGDVPIPPQRFRRFSIAGMEEELAREQLTFKYQEYETQDGRPGIMLDVVDGSLPITEFQHEEWITKSLGKVIDEADETNTVLSIAISRTPFDYSSEPAWLREIHTKRPRLGAKRVISILEKLGFKIVGCGSGAVVLQYDPELVVDPFRHMPGGDALRGFLEQTEQAFIRLSGERGSAGHRARRELAKYRTAMQELYLVLREAQSR